MMNNILEAIGMTPLVKLNHIPQSHGIKCNMCKFIELEIDFFLKIVKFQTLNASSLTLVDQSRIELDSEWFSMLKKKEF